MIPVSYKEWTVTKDKKFIINDVICVGYSIVDDYTISILFAIHQDLFDKYSYINANIQIDTPSEISKFRQSGMYIKDIQSDPEESLKLKDICKYLNTSNLYTTDFNFVYDKEKDYYTIKGVKSIGKNQCEIQEYMINKSVYIQLRIFLEFLKNNCLGNSMFFDESLKSVSFITADSVKLDGTIVEDMKKVIDNRRTFFKITSHYTVHSGPTKFRFNYSCNKFEKITKSLREPMVYKQYFAEFNDDLYVTCTLHNLDTDTLLVILSDTSSEHKHTTVIRLSKELYELTNLKEPDNYIFYDINTVSINFVPHVKF
jgi:hypothetical protein